MLLAKEPILRLQLANLDRERQRELKLADLSDSWHQLANQVAQTLVWSWSETEMWDYHRTRLPFDALPLNLAQWLRGQTSTSRWTTEMLKPLVCDIPQHESLAVYGWAPTWVTSTLALHSSSFFCCFDAQYGWLTPPTLQDSSEGRWEVTRKENDTLGVTELAFTLNATHLTYHDTHRYALPPVQSDTIILSGKLPIWLYVALARHYGQKGKTIAIANPTLQAAVQINGEEVGKRIPWGKIAQN